MKHMIRFICEWIRLVIKLSRLGGVKAIASENLALRQQLITMSRRCKRSPKLTTTDRIIFATLASWINPKRLSKIAILIKPATIIKFHRALVNRKYQRLFSNKSPKKPGPKGPSEKLIDLIIEMKKRNPRFGYLRIAMQIQHTFGIELDKNVIKRVLDKYYKSNYPPDNGPSWLNFLGHMKDSLWSVDLFRCESMTLKSHWVMIVMDQFSRKIIGFAVQQGDLSGQHVCHMFNQIISGKTLPKKLSSDNDPLFRYHQWQANLRILEIDEIKTVPYSPISHPFIERLIGTTRREFLDHLMFWNENDLSKKLDQFKRFYNDERVHSALNRITPLKKTKKISSKFASIDNYRWKSFARDSFSLPIAA